MRKTRLALCITPLLVAILVAPGCAARNPAAPGYAPEQYARDAIAAAQGFIVQAQEHHGAECRSGCALPEIQDAKLCRNICNAINRAVHAQNAAIDALSLYCAGPGWGEGAPCNPQPDFALRLREAVRELDRIVREVRGLLRTGAPGRIP